MKRCVGSRRVTLEEEEEVRVVMVVVVVLVPETLYVKNSPLTTTTTTPTPATPLQELLCKSTGNTLHFAPYFFVLLSIYTCCRKVIT